MTGDTKMCIRDRLTDEEIQQRISELTGEEYPHFTGYLGIYQKGCISISKGAVLR